MFRSASSQRGVRGVGRCSWAALSSPTTRRTANAFLASWAGMIRVVTNEEKIGSPRAKSIEDLVKKKARAEQDGNGGRGGTMTETSSDEQPIALMWRELGIGGAAPGISGAAAAGVDGGAVVEDPMAMATGDGHCVGAAGSVAWPCWWGELAWRGRCVAGGWRPSRKCSTRFGR